MGTPTEETSFEQLVEELQALVARLEAGNLPLY
jgi:exonuclease VII small subunit